MAAPLRRPHSAVIDQLFEEPFLFEFFQAVRLLDRARPDGKSIGHDGPAMQEVVRFVSHLSLTFPPSALYSLEEPPTPADDAPVGPPRMETPFMGLIGPSGVLPTVYTEDLLRARTRVRAPAIDFLNLFHHRLVSLFYRAWEKYNVPVLWEQARRSSRNQLGTDAFTRRLFDMIGLGLEPLRNRMANPDAALVYYAGFFAQQHRSVLVLEALIRDYFGRPARVLTFHGQWLRLPADQQSRLGSSGAHNRLGVDAAAGSRVWDEQSKIRIRVGPLRWQDFHAFSPGGALAEPLMDLVRFFSRRELAFDVQLVLKAEDVPGLKLTGDSRSGSRLGRSAWLRRREFTVDADDAVFRPKDS